MEVYLKANIGNKVVTQCIGDCSAGEHYKIHLLQQHGNHQEYDGINQTELVSNNNDTIQPTTTTITPSGAVFLL